MQPPRRHEGTTALVPVRRTERAVARHHAGVQTSQHGTLVSERIAIDAASPRPRPSPDAWIVQLVAHCSESAPCENAKAAAQAAAAYDARETYARSRARFSLYA